MDIPFRDLNLVVICGRVASAPDLRHDDSGTRQLRMLVTLRGDRPRRRIDVLPVTVWDPEDHLVDPGLPVGARVMVAGMVQRSLPEGPEGQRSRLEVIGLHVAVHIPAGLDVDLATTVAG
ncbi:MAG: single-stranded DNA-binding protein [Acidimicrobiia bacterium]